MYIYSYLFCLYQCQDYCHRVITQLQMMMMMMMMMMIIIIIIKLIAKSEEELQKEIQTLKKLQ